MSNERLFNLYKKIIIQFIHYIIIIIFYLKHTHGQLLHVQLIPVLYDIYFQNNIYIKIMPVFLFYYFIIIEILLIKTKILEI